MSKLKQKKSGESVNPFIHIYKRFDTYIGNVVTKTSDKFVYEEVDEIPRIISKPINFNSGLLKIVAEQLSNIIDNRWRSQEHEIPMKTIRFNINRETGEIIAYNDGYFIDVEKAEYENKNLVTGKTEVYEAYPAEVFFGSALSGTNFNFDQDIKKKTSGKNGIGAKATNIFSKSFTVEHTDPVNHKMFTQHYSNHGIDRTEPKIEKYKGKTGYTKITFTPDFEFFKYPTPKNFKMDDDLYALITKHIYDCAMVTKMNVWLNDEKIVVKDFTKYVKLYYPNNKMIHFKTNYINECILVEIDPDSMDALDIANVSFVNGINTEKGGVHVDAWKNLIFDGILKSFNSKPVKKGEVQLKASAKQLYPYFMLFINCEVDDPDFDSQTKEYLNNPAPMIFDKSNKAETTEFKNNLNNEIKKIMKWEWFEALKSKLELLSDQKFKNKEKQKTVIQSDKYLKANFAGGAKSHECILFIAEGDSAKSMVEAAINQTHMHDYFGVFAIRGKFLNVQKADERKINENNEVIMIKQILNLKLKADYSQDANFETLNYGEVRIISDADDDGIHIRGLLMNFIYRNWPQLYDKKYISSKSMPIVEVNFSRKDSERLFFYSNEAFDYWQNTICEAHGVTPDKIGTIKEYKGYDAKYYKGLGSYAPSRAGEYLLDGNDLVFQKDDYVKYFMDLGFSEKETTVRKEWITNSLIKPDDTKALIDYSSQDGKLAENINKINDNHDNDENENENEIQYNGYISISKFINNQLRIYHIMSLTRGIPSMYDGFKDSTRKIIYAIFQKNYKKAVLVDQMCGAVKEITAYHHGATSLENAIKSLATNIVGYGNNINLLLPDGQFGDRSAFLDGAAAARYINSMDKPIARILYPAIDDNLFEHNTQDGNNVEFKNYLPILPMVLVNGGEGMSCGFKTTIPSYNPLDLIKRINRFLDGKPVIIKNDRLKPWYWRHTGEIELCFTDEKGKEYDHPIAFISKGILEPSTDKKKKGWWDIKELPVGLSRNKFNEYLDFMLTGVKADPKKGARKPSAKTLSKKVKKPEKYLKDWTKHHGNETIHYMIKPTKEFIPEMNISGNFKNLQVKKSLKGIIVLDSNNYPCKYLCAEDLLYDYCKVRLFFYGKRKDYLLELYNKNFKKENNKLLFVKYVIDEKLKLNQKKDELDKSLTKLGLERIADEKGNMSYDYLLSMQMRTILSEDKVAELEKSIEKLKNQIETLEGKTPHDLWKEDLKEFEKKYIVFLADREKEIDDPKTKTKTKGKNIKKKVKFESLYHKG
jgi:DNA topoisomerase-2